MAFNSPGELVDGPNCVPARYGLLSVAEIEDRADGHWLQGFYTEEPECGDVTETRAYSCPQPETPKEKSGSGLIFPESDPFVMIGEYDCSTGGRKLSDAWDLAEADLDRQESRTLERIFWSGVDTLGNNIRRTLGGLDADFPVVDVTPGTGAVSITDGVAILESWAGENMQCAPILHAQRGIATYLAERNLIAAEGQIMFNKGTGSRIAVGGGYLATGPNGTPAPPAGEGWMFVTGGIKIVRGPKFFTPDKNDYASAVDRNINDITVYAERHYGITLACGIAAVRTTLKSCCC